MALVLELCRHQKLGGQPTTAQGNPIALWRNPHETLVENVCFVVTKRMSFSPSEKDLASPSTFYESRFVLPGVLGQKKVLQWCRFNKNISRSSNDRKGRGLIILNRVKHTTKPRSQPPYLCTPRFPPVRRSRFVQRRFTECTPLHALLSSKYITQADAHLHHGALPTFSQ